METCSPVTSLSLVFTVDLDQDNLLWVAASRWHTFEKYGQSLTAGQKSPAVLSSAQSLSDSSAPVWWCFHGCLLTELRFRIHGKVQAPVLLQYRALNEWKMFKLYFTWHFQEEDKVLRCMSVMINVADQLYYPCEHVAWAADAELIKVKSDKWWILSTVLWGVSLLLGALR